MPSTNSFTPLHFEITVIFDTSQTDRNDYFSSFEAHCFLLLSMSDPEPVGP